ncbi:MAG: hypothetical protein ACFB21_16275 [Opitutales bacterium]
MKAWLRHPQTPYHLALGGLGLCLVALFFSLLAVGAEDFRKHQAFAEREAIYRRQLENLETEHARQTAYLNEVLANPGFREKLIRERLGYARDGEVVIRFEEAEQR